MMTPSTNGNRENVLVLIVEDDAAIAEALAFLVEDAGYTARIATNGTEALVLLQDQHADLIITDLMMPGMNGAAFIATLRVQQAQGQVIPPIVLMSAAGRDILDSVGADAVVRKPFELAEIEDLLAHWLVN